MCFAANEWDLPFPPIASGKQTVDVSFPSPGIVNCKAAKVTYMDKAKNLKSRALTTKECEAFTFATRINHKSLIFTESEILYNESPVNVQFNLTNCDNIKFNGRNVSNDECKALQRAIYSANAEHLSLEESKIVFIW